MEGSLDEKMPSLSNSSTSNSEAYDLELLEYIEEMSVLYA